MTTKSSTIEFSTIPSKKANRGRGFTLLEILIVVLIIAILVGLAFPVYSIVMYKAQSTAASSMINQIGVALNSYQNDYGDWPPALLTNTATNSAGNSMLIANTNPYPATNLQVWTTLYQTLTAGGSTNFLASNNSRRTVYMQIPIKYLSNPSSPTNSTTFFDPWSREYNLAADVTGSNIIAGIPLTSNAAAGGNTNMTINASLAIWSYGNAPAKPVNYIINWK